MSDIIFLTEILNSPIGQVYLEFYSSELKLAIYCWVNWQPLILIPVVLEKMSKLCKSAVSDTSHGHTNGKIHLCSGIINYSLGFEKIKLTRYIYVYRNNSVTAPDNWVWVMIISSSIGTASHRDHPAGIWHLIIYLQDTTSMLN